MRQRASSVLPETGTGHHGRPPIRPPVAERIAGWSARHRKTAVLGWLVMVVAVFIGGQMIGTPDLPQYDAGQSGVAEHTLKRLGVDPPPVEDVLIQARRPGATFASDPEMRAATAQVAAALHRLPRSAAGIRTPAGPGGGALVSADGRSVLV